MAETMESMEAPAASDKVLFDGAQNRALISAFLNQGEVPGTYNIKQIMDGTKLSRHIATPLLREMAQQGQIYTGTAGTHKLFSTRPIPTEMTMGERPRAPGPKKAKKPVRKPVKATQEADELLKMVAKNTPRTAAPAKDIELVLNGMQIVVGKNPLTGRIRIVLEG